MCSLQVGILHGMHHVENTIKTRCCDAVLDRYSFVCFAEGATVVLTNYIALHAFCIHQDLYAMHLCLLKSLSLLYSSSSIHFNHKMSRLTTLNVPFKYVLRPCWNHGGLASYTGCSRKHCLYYAALFRSRYLDLIHRIKMDCTFFVRDV